MIPTSRVRKLRFLEVITLKVMEENGKAEKLNPRSNAKAHVGYPSATLPSSADSGTVTYAKGIRKEGWCFLSTTND